MALVRLCNLPRISAHLLFADHLCWATYFGSHGMMTVSGLNEMVSSAIATLLDAHLGELGPDTHL